MTNPRRRLLKCVCAMALTSSSTACWSGAEVRDCPLGEQEVDGQCVPTSTLVFERCVASFRKTSSVDEQSEGTEVQVQVPGGYGGAVGRDETDRTHEQYATLPDTVLPEAIEECRRQEQVEREGQLARARTEMEEARAKAADADAARREAERALRRSETALDEAHLAYDELETAKDALGVEMEEVRERLRDRERLLSQVAPCEVEDWARCAETALAAKRAGDYASAHAKYALACGDAAPEACTNWGVMFEHGLGVEPSIDVAIDKHDLGCEHGSARACLNAGRAHESRGRADDARAAASTYTLACEGDEMHACARLGALFDRGHGVTRDAERAAKHYRTACRGGDAAGCVGLGGLHERGDGVARDPETAERLFEQACAAGEPAGCQAAERLSRRWESDASVG